MSLKNQDLEVFTSRRVLLKNVAFQQKLWLVKGVAVFLFAIADFYNRHYHFFPSMIHENTVLVKFQIVFYFALRNEISMLKISLRLKGY